ncbi:hypothetical protein IQ07DRAFT_323983 [Pyrenochaeta sp. DS3sAY3a]|nr:hypothetical protein IQ07DRAFT_323983 [Pyrenochaeta sp. DS3sAY3a]
MAQTKNTASQPEGDTNPEPTPEEDPTKKPGPKQTAKNSTGGKEPRKDLSSKALPKGTSTRQPREICKLGPVDLEYLRPSEKNAGLLIDKRAFSRLVREITNSHKEGFRCEYGALKCLQEAAEAFMIGYFEDCLINAVDARRLTVQIEDSLWARRSYSKLYGGAFDVSETQQDGSPDAKED